MNVLLVSPKTPDTFWNYRHVLKFVSKKAVFPPLGLLTIAAMLPKSWKLKLVDLNVTRLKDKDIHWADHVMMSAMIVHEQSVHEIIARCKTLGKNIIAGGPLFTTGYEKFKGDVHAVIGEAEDLMATLIRDMEQNTLKPFYQQSGDRPDISKTPVPHWDLIHFKDYVTMPVQFSRGCPYDCEFCDIIIMNGRKPRTKSPGQMLLELEAIRLRGWKDMIFIVDDNFIGNKVRVKELLPRLIEWRTHTHTKIGFFTEASVNLADEPELLQLMSQAGFKRVFLGIETPNPSSLEECHKLQNTRRDLTSAIHTIQQTGMEVMGGFIVGFDSDPSNIFDLQFDFIQKSGIVTAMVGLLNALPKTPLYLRLIKEGRLRTDTTGNNTQASINFEPKLDRDFLLAGYRKLMNTLYHPRNYYQRIQTFLKYYTPSGPRMRFCLNDIRALFKSFWLMGVWYRGRVAYWRFVITTLFRHPRKMHMGIALAINGHHFRKVARSL